MHMSGHTPTHMPAHVSMHMSANVFTVDVVLQEVQNALLQPDMYRLEGHNSILTGSKAITRYLQARKP